MKQVVSEINTKITLDYLRHQNENQYFERKGIGISDENCKKRVENSVGKREE